MPDVRLQQMKGVHQRAWIRANVGWLVILAGFAKNEGTCQCSVRINLPPLSPPGVGEGQSGMIRLTPWKDKLLYRWKTKGLLFSGKLGAGGLCLASGKVGLSSSVCPHSAHESSCICMLSPWKDRSMGRPSILTSWDSSESANTLGNWWRADLKLRIEECNERCLTLVGRWYGSVWDRHDLGWSRTTSCACQYWAVNLWWPLGKLHSLDFGVWYLNWFWSEVLFVCWGSPLQL